MSRCRYCAAVDEHEQDNCPVMREWVEKAVAGLPPLTEQQVQTVARLLRSDDR